MNCDDRFGSRSDRKFQAPQVRSVITDTLIYENRDGSQTNNRFDDRRGRMRRQNDFVAACYVESLQRQKNCIGAASNANGMADAAIHGKLFLKSRKIGTVE